MKNKLLSALVALNLIITFGLVTAVQENHKIIAEAHATSLKNERSIDKRHQELIRLDKEIKTLTQQVLILEQQKIDLTQLEGEISTYNDEVSQIWWCIKELNKVVY